MRKLTPRGLRIYKAMRRHYTGRSRSLLMYGGKTWDGRELTFEQGTARRSYFVARMQEAHNTPIPEIIANYG